MTHALLASALVLVVVCADGRTTTPSTVECECVNGMAASCRDRDGYPSTTWSLNASAADVIRAQLPGLTDLTLRNCLIRGLQSGNFATLYRVRRLNLSSNFITNLQPGVFTQLTSLKVLNLSSNVISDVNNGWLKGLVNLQVLDMSSNNISNLEGDAFATPQRVSDSEPQLYSLNSSLHCLDLSFNKISLLNNSVFSVLKSLRQLNLAGNNLEALKGQCFNGLISLQQLDVSENHISSIEDGAFSKLNNVQKLNLSRNQLETLNDQCFCGLTHLQQLDVSCNRISSLSPGTFQATGGLVELMLADNPVLGHLRQELVVLVGTGRRLQTVDISRSGLTQVPDALTRSIRTLKLQGNKVTTVQCGDLDSYPLLQFLNLADNQIQELEEDALGRLEVLSILYLSGNYLLTVPSSLPSGLIILHLQHNHIQQLNLGDLQGLPHLRYLSLRHNGIKTIQNGVLSQLSALETLDISENPLKSLPGNALSGPLMTVLRLSHLGSIMSVASHSTEMSFPVTSPERLKVLELDSSPILAQQLLADTAALAAFRQLRELNLINTGLTNIRPDLFHFLPRLRVLRLNGNQWKCKDMLWLANWIRQQQIHQKQQLETSLQDAYCASPPHLACTPVIHLHDADFSNRINSTDPTAENNTYEVTTEARYDASVTTKMFSIPRIRSTPIPGNKMPPISAHPLDNQTTHRLFSIQSSNVTNTSSATINRVDIHPVNTSHSASEVKSENSFSANNAFTISSISTESETFKFNRTTIYENNLITNIHSTDSSVQNNMPDSENNFMTTRYTDITISGTYPADEEPNDNALSTTKSDVTVDDTKQTQIMFFTVPSLRTDLKTINNIYDKHKLIPTEKKSIQRNGKALHHMENATHTQNQNISSKSVTKVVHTNIKNTDVLKTYITTPSNATRALFTDKSWLQDKFFPDTRNKTFLPSFKPRQSTHNNFNPYKTIPKLARYDTVLQQTLSNEDKYKQYQDKPSNNTVKAGESLNKESQDNTKTGKNRQIGTHLLNKALIKHTFNISDFTNKSTAESAHKMEFKYHAVMKHEYTNISTSHFDPHFKNEVQNPSYRNHSSMIPVGFHTNWLKLVSRKHSANLEEASKPRNATSSDMNDSENITSLNSANAVNTTPPVQGVNLVFGNVTLAMGEKSLFQSGHVFAPGVHTTVPASLTLGSHPSMFLLLGIGNRPQRPGAVTESGVVPV